MNPRPDCLRFRRHVFFFHMAVQNGVSRGDSRNLTLPFYLMPCLYSQPWYYIIGNQCHHSRNLHQCFGCPPPLKLLLHRRCRRRHRQFLHHVQERLLLPAAAAPAAAAPAAPAGRLRRVARILGGVLSVRGIKLRFKKSLKLFQKVAKNLKNWLKKVCRKGLRALMFEHYMVIKLVLKVP